MFSVRRLYSHRFYAWKLTFAGERTERYLDLQSVINRSAGSSAIIPRSGRATLKETAQPAIPTIRAGSFKEFRGPVFRSVVTLCLRIRMETPPSDLSRDQSVRLWRASTVKSSFTSAAYALRGSRYPAGYIIAVTLLPPSLSLSLSLSFSWR